MAHRRSMASLTRRIAGAGSGLEMAIRPPEWMVGTPCAATDPAMFHPENGVPTSRAAAMRLCWTVCTVREQCLEYALKFESGENNNTAVAFGIWGGTSPTERKRILKERALATKAALANDPGVIA